MQCGVKGRLSQPGRGNVISVGLSVMVSFPGICCMSHESRDFPFAFHLRSDRVISDGPQNETRSHGAGQGYLVGDVHRKISFLFPVLHQAPNLDGISLTVQWSKEL